MLISTEDLNTLLEILDQEYRTFRSVAERFVQTFSSERNFELAATIILLITNHASQTTRIKGSLDAKQLKLHQRLHGFFIVQDIYRNYSITENPFTHFFVNIVQENPISNERNIIGLENQIESFFCIHILSPERYSIDSLQVSTPSIFITNFLKNRPIPTELPKQNFTELNNITQDTFHLAPLRTLGINAVIKEGVSFQPLRGSGRENSRFVSEIDIEQELTLRCFEPEFAREPPSLFPISQDELEWIYPDLPLELLWDTSMVASLDADEVGSLMAVALQQQLTDHEQERLIQSIQEDAQAVKNYGLTPQQLPDLINHNPSIAYQCLLSLCGTPQIAGFFEALANMDMSVNQVGLHSMEVVNNLTKSTREIPKEFLHLYIANCIKSCEAINDPFFQTRLVRLVCVFLQSLIRGGIIEIKEVFIEVQAFCIEFSRIREAAGLFKLLRSLQQSTDQDEKRVKLQF